ncbi:hypothetical protein [Spongiimicrobium salis]|uniref:hypothetical protein n=1 Tax=Spongiimicrobium salis TaxID=1667022 RepID=UPI00374DD6B2
MKIKLLFIVVIFSIVNCKESEKQNIDEVKALKRADSIAKVEYLIKEKNRIRLDSIERVEQDKVIGEVRFMMSEAVAKEKIAKFIEESSRQKFSNYDEKYPFIGNYEFSDFKVEGRYDDDKLYSLSLDGAFISWENFETKVPQQINYLKDVIQRKYGLPDDEKHIPKSFQMKEDSEYEICSWNVGKKKITITVEDSGTFYNVNLHIYLPAKIEALKKARLIREDKISEESKDVF